MLTENKPNVNTGEQCALQMFSARIPGDLRQQIKELAVAKRTSVQVIAIAALRAHVKRHAKREGAAA